MERIFMHKSSDIATMRKIPKFRCNQEPRDLQKKKKAKRRAQKQARRRK